MKTWIRILLGDRLFLWFSANLMWVAYVFVLLTFLVINSYSGVRKCQAKRILEESNKELRWEFFELQAEYTRMKSRKEVVPQNYSDYVDVHYIITEEQKD